MVYQMEPDEARPKIALFGVFGAGNLGNECTLQALLHNLRRYVPKAEVHCICTGPEETLRNNDIASASRIREMSLPPMKNRMLRLFRRIVVGIPVEIYRWFKAIRTLKGAKMLVMTGTGMLGDFGIHPFDLHYDIVKWSVIAKLCRCKLLFLSVGVGPIRHPLSRCFVKAALSLADYRSYRDDFSKQYLESIHFDTKCDTVRPDLAFSFPTGRIPANHDRDDRKPVVGVGLMTYFGKRGTSENGEAVYHEYISNLGSFVIWLLGRNYDVRLLIGDTMFDSRALRDLRALLERRGIHLTDSRIIDEPADSVDDVLSQLATTDFVIASRLHNILLALMLNKPVVAISYHEKIDALMTNVGLRSFCQSIEQIEVEALTVQFGNLEKGVENIKRQLASRAEACRTSLDAQYDLIFRALRGSMTAEETKRVPNPPDKFALPSA
jgi:polysaccharide pyruvyl transferase WcaK-like protein